MNVEYIQNKIEEIFGSQIKFNKEMKNSFSLLKEGQIENLIEWCEKVKNEEIPAHRGIRDGESFFLTFKKFGNKARSIVIKIKNGEYIEFHLGNHDYYDNIREEYGLKQNSYRY